MLDMHIRPSDIMGIEDAYTAFCFDEACADIVNRIKNGEQPIISRNGGVNENRVYSKPSDLYRKYEK